VDVHHAGDLLDQVVVDGQDLEAAVLQRVEDRSDLRLQENEIAHDLGLTAGRRAMESGP
jgi:hypothetical protein